MPPTIHFNVKSLKDNPQHGHLLLAAICIIQPVLQKLQSQEVKTDNGKKNVKQTNYLSYLSIRNNFWNITYHHHNTRT